MPRILTSPMIAACLAAALAGCAAHARKHPILPHGDTTMSDVWQAQTGGSPGGSDRQGALQLAEARLVLRRPLTGAEASVDLAAYTRTAQTEIQAQFHRLPNPDLVMYVFPHLAGSNPTPVPGYSTVFPMFEQVHYALPGDRTETY